ncbi:NAD(P)/FAD-dependent oxidoreductase [Nitrosomonas halophila]|uniref:NADH dehydrogenase n=1 Tax=Nitrosomonas halophila TaxID=44576 RepID=A0A1H3G284_9PROT|nr:FAD-dependent oxidoreductase [Nitrosomonas halophila]SDX96469.1 NADH dehydrogenase [Nitrosomonas halophila]
MAFLPLYIPGHKQLKIVIAGGGYAGIAALTTLRRYMPEAEITLIDPRADHLKITHLHETFRYPFSDLLVPFSQLAQRFDCRHVQGELAIDDAALQQWQQNRCLDIGELTLPFDYLLIASGAQSARIAAKESVNVFDLEDFAACAGAELLGGLLAADEGPASCISVIGGGATGIQFLFEIAEYLRRQRSGHTLRLIDGGERVLRQFPQGFARYVETRMQELGIEFYPEVRFLGQQADKLLLEEKNSGHAFELPSIMSLVFAGKKPDNRLATNLFGQVVVAGHAALGNIFAAGDCAVYQSLGSNAMTAQSAVRKGKLAARNILRHSGMLKVLEPYLHRDIGYVVSLGPADAVGWLALENNVVTGMPALVIKEIVEAQYDLLLTGVDTYLV